MKNIYIGDNYEIQCYKHNSKIHRCWSEAVILDIKKDYIVCGNNKALVTQSPVPGRFLPAHIPLPPPTPLCPALRG